MQTGVNDHFTPFDKGKAGENAYERKLPDNFASGENDDLFMRSILSNYALQGKEAEGNPKFQPEG